jgi:dephospho-CoA kinase
MFSDDRKIIVVVGPACAGKNTFCVTARTAGISSYNISDDVWKTYDSSAVGQPIDDFVSLTRRSQGDEYFTQLTLERIRKDNPRVCVISGCRAVAEIELIRRTGQAAVIGIYADAMTRFQRSRDRGRSDAPSSFHEFLRRDYRQLTWGLASIMLNVDAIMLNTEGIAEFEAAVNTYIDSGVGNSSSQL